MEKILEVKNLYQSFELNKGLLDRYTIKKGKIVRNSKKVNAVNGISFDIKKGKVFSLVGESGCGKSTTARTIAKLLEPKSGSIFFNNLDLTPLKKSEMRPFRSDIQMIFQDPFASLNPRHKVIDIIAEPIRVHNNNLTKKESKIKAIEVLEQVGIRREQVNRFPHQFSGGQRQRIGIARALAVNPKMIIADEPVSALDVSIQAQILNLLMDLKDDLNLSFLFIGHDLSVVKHITDEIGIMYLGKIVEKGSVEDIFGNAQHPYTKLLLSSIPTIGENLGVEKIENKGELPSAIDLPKGCYFQQRCPYAVEECHREQPREVEVNENHFVSCFMVEGN